MVNFVLPKYITKTARDSHEYKFRTATLASDAQGPRTPTCLRCLVNIAKTGATCDKPADKRCEHCVAGNRGGCTLIPASFNGRYERLYELWDEYATAVEAASEPKKSSGVQETGAALARAQKAVTSALESSKRVAGRSGEDWSLPTSRPESTEDFLALILQQTRRTAEAQSSLAESARRIANYFAGSEDSSSEEEDDEDMMPETPKKRKRDARVALPSRKKRAPSGREGAPNPPQQAQPPRRRGRPLLEEDDEDEDETVDDPAAALDAQLQAGGKGSGEQRDEDEQVPT